MDIVLISGYLGTGKTTLVLALIEFMANKSKKKIAVLVNDFGRIGIDGKIMNKFGISVKELPSGCICCSLGANLLAAVETVKELFNPDLLIIEPSGVADPGAVRDLLKAPKNRSYQSIKTVVMIDAIRHASIIKALGALVEKQLAAADILILNKIDQAEEKDLFTIEQAIRTQGITVPLIRVSAKTRLNLNLFLDVI